MRLRCMLALACALVLGGATAGAAGFEGLRPDGPDAVKGQVGRIDALDAEARTLRIGGNTFEAPADLALDFETLHVGDRIVVHYRMSGSRLLITGVELMPERES